MVSPVSGNPRLAVRALVPGDPGHPARLDVDLAFDAGITSVMGPSGAGKSTLLGVIAGLVTPASGHVALNGDALFDSSTRVAVPPHKRRVALVFQSLALFPHLGVLANVEYGLPAGDGRRERALNWLGRARVAHLADRRPSSLSGGEAQRVALARAFASEPRALLLDEPFSALDAALRTELATELRTLVAELGIPAVLVTHHREDAYGIGMRVVELDRGRVGRE